jgi:hypothetical protein
MSAAGPLLDELAEIGATVQSADNRRLIVRAGLQAVPAELVERLRHAKDEVLVTLATTSWQSQFEVRTIERQVGGARSRPEAEQLAWGDLQCRWHRLHRDLIPEWRCAGCGQPIGARAALTLGDHSRVHLDTAGLDCVLAYGRRWRAAATRALVDMGLRAPEADSSA